MGIVTDRVNDGIFGGLAPKIAGAGGRFTRRRRCATRLTAAGTQIHHEERHLKNVTCIEDLRVLHRRRTPRAFFDYADSGSYNEETLRANRADLEALKLRQRVLVDVSARSLATTVRRAEDRGAAGAGAGRLDRHAARRRRNPGGARGQRGRHSLSRSRPCRSARSRTWRRRRLSRSGSSSTSSRTAASPRRSSTARRRPNATRWC